MTDLGSADRKEIEGIVTALESAWNAGDGDAFAAPFADDADFVNVRAEHFRGRDTIAVGHTGIFRTFYEGSVNRYEIDSMRLLQPDVALVHVKATLDVPTGPLEGRHRALFSMVLMRSEGPWRIATLHNTLEPPPRP